MALPAAATHWLELEKVVPLDEVQRLTTLSPDTIRRRYPNLIVQLSPRRRGMRLRDVLTITASR